MNFTAPQTPEGYALVTTMLKHAAEEMRDSAGTPWTTEH
jgi:hypothetical protein